jgi:uncharacterized NAD(P)/FAD-binding protein YdhS
MRKARVLGIEAEAGGLIAALEQGGRVERHAFDSIVLCTGPERDLNRRPFTRNLLASGIASHDRLKLGLAVDRWSRLIAKDGQVHQTIRALGPMTRGTFGEMTGAPDILRQIVIVVDALAAESAAMAEPEPPRRSSMTR